jgi:hypothetical protein
LAKTLAIAHVETPNKVALWCNFTKATFKDDTLLVEILNGYWAAHLIERNRLRGVNGKPDMPCVVCWEGEVPYPENRDYNSAIKWIQEQIDNVR